MMATGSSSSRPSLSDLTNKKAQEEKVDEKKNDTSAKEDSVTAKQNEEKKDSSSNSNEEAVDAKTGLLKAGSEIKEEEKPVDKQVGKKSDNDKDPFGNNDGVTNSGNVNVINKTPFDMSAESAAETMERYGYSDQVPQELIDNPNVETIHLMKNYQIPGGTHIHPDVARDNYNRIVGGRTEHGNVDVVTQQKVYATEAPVDDKGIKNPVPEDLA